MSQTDSTHRSERSGHLPATAVRRPVATSMIFIGLVALGAVSFSRLPIDLLPAMDFPRITVATEYPGVGPEEIETLITRPVEEAMATIQGVEELEAISSEGRSRVTLQFVWGTSLDAALADVRANLERVRMVLPPDAEAPIAFKFDMGNMPILHFSLSGEGLEPRDLRRLAEDRIKYRIERVEGVARLDVRGGLLREIHVELDADRIAALGLSPNAIVEKLRSENRDVPGGQVDRGDREYVLKTVGEYESFEAVGRTIVAHRPEGPVRLGDIARVIDSTEEPRSIVEIDGQQGIRLSVSKLSGANTIEVAERVRAEVQRIAADYPDLELNVLMDTSEFIKDSVSSVEQGAVIGGLLAVLILFFFLRDVRATAIIGTAIPISAIATFWLMDLGSITLNTISFGGLALGIGMLVDNAIVILENIFRKREEGVADPRQAAIRGSAEVAAAVTSSTLTTVAVFVPVLFLTGFPRIFFGQLAIVVVFSLACSLLVAMTLVPMLSSRLLARGGQSAVAHAGGDLMNRMEGFYGRLVALALRRKAAVLGLAVLLLVGAFGVVGAGWVRTELMPESDQGEVDIDIELPSGTRLEVTQVIVDEVARRVVPLVPETEHLTKVAGPPGGWSMAGSNYGNVELELKDERTRTSMEIASALRPVLNDIPDARIRVRTGGGFWVFNALRGGGDRLQVNIAGHDLATSAELTRRVEAIMAEVPGVADVRVSRQEGMGEMAVVVDDARAAAMGVSPAAVGDTVRTYVLGTIATYLREAGDEYPVIVRLQETDRKYLEQVLDLPVFTPDGRQVPLRAVASVREQAGPTAIQRKGQERVVYVTGTLEDARTDLGSVVAETQRRIREQVVVPEGFEVYMGGEAEQQAETFGSLLTGLLLAVALVYMVMAAQFESLRQPFVIMFSVPFALVGVVLTLMLTGTSFNMNGFLGVIVLVGIVVNNAIVLVDYVNMYRRDYGMPLREALVTGSMKRLRPILMTTLTTVLALLPVALGLGEGGELNAPLARVVAGGLTFSTLVTLVIVPVIYWLMEVRRARREGEQVDAEPSRPLAAA